MPAHARTPARSTYPRRHAQRAVAAALAVVACGAVAVLPAVAHEPRSGGGQHTVQRGDTLSEIAAANSTTVSALVQANGLSSPDRIVAGQVLVIPGAAGAAVVHVVAPGETLSEIARDYGMTTADLASRNGISNPNLVRVGQRLTVTGGGGGGGGGATPAPAHSHTVASGETLSHIAARYGVTVGAIVARNGISNANLVRAGQTLQIPAGGGAGGGGGGGRTTNAYATTGGSDGRTGVPGTHTVASGETLAAIAARYGVSQEALAAANGIPRPHNLYAGAKLYLSAPNRLPNDIAQCPVPGATFVNDWGFPRSGGRGHAGTDLFAPRGTPVRAPASGVVSYATGSIGGLQFRLVGDDGTTYLGSHLDAFGTQGRVNRGDVVGYVGDSGNARGSRPHLHFEIHPDGGSAMNPFPVVRAVC